MFKKILIADDHYVVRIGTSLSLEASHREIEFAENYYEIEKLLANKVFDILILDINMPGIEKSVIKEIKKQCPLIKIMLFTSFTGDIVLQYIKEGADGYLNKQCNSKDMIEALNMLSKTGYFFPSEITLKFINNAEKVNPKLVLSPKEYQIFQLFTQGFGNLEITNYLSIKPGTVSTYKKRIFKKLNVNNIAELIKIQLNFNNLF